MLKDINGVVAPGGIAMAAEESGEEDETKLSMEMYGGDGLMSAPRQLRSV